MDLAQALKDRRDQIVSRFVAEVQRKDLSPPGISRSLLANHVPKFIDEMMAELTRLGAMRPTLDAIDTSEPARRHGEQRWNLGYDLEALIREYGILRHCILETAKELGVQVSIDEFDVFAKCLSVGVAVAVTEYVKYRDEQLNAEKANVEFLAEAGELLTSSLDYRSTLGRLTGLLVPRMADWCAVHLEDDAAHEMPVAHVDPSKVEIIREIYRRYPLPRESPHGYPYVVRTGEPQLMRAVDPALFATVAQSEEHLNLLHRLNSCSWMIIPLQVQGRMFGALTLVYSESGRHYDSADLVLAGELARRAAAAIDNARLYDLSQAERSRVEVATRAKDEFVAMVSHELRTPLSAILGWLNLLRNGGLSDEKRQHALAVIERNATAQSQIVSDLLDISRIATGKIRLNPTEVDVSDVVDVAVEAVRPAAEAKRIRIDIEIDRDNVILRADGDRLQQVAWNLLSNAVKFTRKNGIVEVSLRRIHSDIELTITDNGEGIEPEFLPHIFEIFRQSDGSASAVHGGLGIGLSIVKHIVDLHGGSIEARSPGRGGGTTFVVRLPTSPAVSAPVGFSGVPATKGQSENLSIPIRTQGIRVLVVDDAPDARELVAYILERCEMEVRVAGSVAEAFSDLAQYTPDVIVSDIAMPVEDGYALVRSVRTHSDETKRNIPMIALTAFARNEDRTRALVEGFNMHLAKPAPPAALVQAVVDLAGHVPTQRGHLGP